jgi:large subunit ribosomal protein L13
MLEEKPEEVIRLAVKRMLPKNKLGHRMLKRLKSGGGTEPSLSSPKATALGG